MRRAWLAPFTGQVIVETNRQPCLPRPALHKATSDGYAPTRELWGSRHRLELTLAEATDLCRCCHQSAPFCNFNGNNFVAVTRRVIASLNVPPDQAAALRSPAGHVVAGTATPEERAAFTDILDRQAPDSNERPHPLS